MYVYRNIEVRSCKSCCCVKAIIIAYFECVCVCVCVCILSYPACNANAPYCRLWPNPLYNIFLHYLRNVIIFVKKTLLKT